ncbi:phage tail protein [Halomonas daqingensis]|uniref:phage tail tube protein n=1 Tax=Billgrantia desiderata TaxID=52021 RepID=UPI001F440618|nr:phage tail tube protein [Halomonas desiderata]MCE8027544.1 phage tail protein [Halomonas desiderata]
MTQLTGKAKVRVDGSELLTDVDSTLNVGGSSREPVTGPGGVQGYRESPEAPTLTTTVRHTADLDLISLGRIRNATVLFETDTGDTYVLRRAFVTDTVEMSGGNVRLNWSGMGVERL